MAVSEGYVSVSCSHGSTNSSLAPKVNILINHGGHACLAGFTLLTIASDQQTIPPLVMASDAIRWMSPELLDPGKFDLKESCPTKKSDCYGLGMVMYEVLSEQVPFGLHESHVVIQKVLAGKRPGRPQGGEGKLFTGGMWGMLELCWKHQPDHRISAESILLGLERNLPHSPLGLPKGRWVGRLAGNVQKTFEGII